MTTTVARRNSAISRTLKALVPLIKADLDRGDEAGLEYYRRAGDKLREARDQVAGQRWTGWLSKNFELSPTTARRYMRLSEIAEDKPGRLDGEMTMHAVIGERHTRTPRLSDVKVNMPRVHVDRDLLSPEQETRRDEIRLHRDLALELIDIGYKALATRLHPDRGGSKDAMARLNRVRIELKDVAETRRFV
jgi:hypothetical protein